VGFLSLVANCVPAVLFEPSGGRSCCFSSLSRLSGVDRGLPGLLVRLTFITRPFESLAREALDVAAVEQADTSAGLQRTKTASSF
jgi:hypothetical protein